MSQFAPVVNLDRTRGFDDVGNVATAVHLHCAQGRNTDKTDTLYSSCFLSNLWQIKIRKEKMWHERIFFFPLTNSILLLGPGDHFDFIFPGKRRKMAAPQTNTKDARAEKRRRRTDRDEGKDYNWSSSCLPLLRKASLAFFLSFFLFLSLLVPQKIDRWAKKSLKELLWLPVSAPCTTGLQAVYFLSPFPPLWAPFGDKKE